MNRRSFLGWLGGAIVAAATPELFHVAACKVARRYGSPFPCVYEVGFAAKDGAPEVVEAVLRRVGHPVPILREHMGRYGAFRWVAGVGGEIPCRDGVAALVVEGDVDWGIYFELDGERYYQGKGRLAIPLRNRNLI